MRLLASDGYAVKAWGVPEIPDAPRPSDVTGAARVVLPVPLCRDGRLYGTALSMDEVWARLAGHEHVYAGAVPEHERNRAEAAGISLADYFADEALAIRNAVPTAEGAIAAAMEHLNVTLRGTPCLVLGFGRIGKLLARGLASLGAPVSVAARKSADLAWAEALGCVPLDIRRLAGRLGGFRAVFNTVPDMVLPAALLRELRWDCVLIELASRPGVDADAARELGLDYVRASGLPGKVAPETAARAIRETLYRLWEEET